MRAALPHESISEILARWMTNLTPADVPDDVGSMVRKLLLDSVGLMIASRREDYMRAVIDAWRSSGPCTAIGHALECDAASAAMINGTAIHGEDYDDTFTQGQVHPASSVIPAVLAIGEQHGLSGTDAFRGCAAGMELMCRLALVAPTAAHRAGFHPTAIIGAMGAAAGVCVALKASPAQLVNALGIAGSFASGIIEYLAEGTSTKRMHPGWAAQSGIRAALMGRSGFTGPRTVFEGAHGFFHAFGDPAVPVHLAAVTDELSSAWRLGDNSFKLYACGAIAQPYIDCAIQLAARGVPADQIESIACEVGEGTVHRLWEPLPEKRHPSTSYSAKFSIPYCIAVAFLDGDAGLRQFTEARLQDPAVLSLAARVNYVIDPNNGYPKNYTGHVRAALRDGSNVEIRQDHMRGGRKAPLAADDLSRKFVNNLSFGGVDDSRAEEISAICRGLFEAPDLSALGRLRLRS